MKVGRTCGPGCNNCSNCENTNQLTTTMDEVEVAERQESSVGHSWLKTMMIICKRMTWKKTGKCKMIMTVDSDV